MKVKIWILTLVMAAIFSVPAVLAATTTFCPNPLDTTPDCSGAGSNTIQDLIAKVVGYITILAIPVLAVMILYGAFEIMVSEGNAEKFKKGQKIIFYAIIGFVIIALGSGVGYIINNFLTK